jgi:hypothetical protein
MFQQLALANKAAPYQSTRAGSWWLVDANGSVPNAQDAYINNLANLQSTIYGLRTLPADSDTARARALRVACCVLMSPSWFL